MAKSNGPSLSRVRDVASRAAKQVPLDEIDVALLKILASDGRASQRYLASTLRISTPTVSERMARLEKSGVISGYSASVDWSIAGFPETVYLSITTADGSDVATVMTSLWEIPEVEDVNLVTGELDLLVRLRVRDNTHLRALLMDGIWQIAGIQGTATMMSVAEMPRKNFTEGLLSTVEPSRTRGRID